MRIDRECIECALHSYNRIMDHHGLEESTKTNELRGFLALLSKFDYERTPPELGRIMHNRLKKALNNPDPYLQDKLRYNELLLGSYTELKNLCNNDFDKAVAMAATGNLLDLGITNEVDTRLIADTAFSRAFAIDHRQLLQQELRIASKLVYLGDNAGEIVMDKLLVENVKTLAPDLDIIYVVRGGSIINDVTMQDARQTGMDKIVTVIDNGYDAPGTVLDKCSDEFLSHYRSADIIISKGQGNFETLSEAEENIYFLLTAKCGPVARRLNTEVGNLVAYKPTNVSR